MDKKWMALHLPEAPPNGYEDWIEAEAADDLAADLLIFSAERRKIYPPLKATMDAKDFEPVRSVWAAYCTCTVCGEDFYTEYVPGAKAFRLYQGEDGQLYPVDPAGTGEPETFCDDIEDLGYDGCYVDVASGDGITCPYCGANVDVLHRSKLRGGRTKQVLGCSVHNVHGYTAVIYWLTAKHIGEEGYCWTETYPRDAYVIGEKGGLTRYRHVRTGAFYAEIPVERWELSGSVRDSVSIPYHDWGSINNAKAGGAVWPKAPDLTGCTGEKTGLAEYIQAGGMYPVTYLKIWCRHRNVENLVKAGWCSLVEQSIDRHTETDARVLSTELNGMDLTKQKPHEMLRMSKADFRELTRREKIWNPGKLETWEEYLDVGGRCSALEFDSYYDKTGAAGVGSVIEVLRVDQKADLPEMEKYLEKQGLSLNDARYLVDAREMAGALHPERALTEEERWPRHLMAVHDRLEQLQRTEGDPRKNAELAAGFRRIVDAYGCLEWTDGDLRILLPRSNAELAREGTVLRHCVGGYGNSHCAGKLIFFVRKYRRPERSYYTLNIDMTGGAPKEIQLHGYGNEHHGPHKEYYHRIPKKVRDFVDRWEREVLARWWLAQMNSKKKEKSA